MVVMENGMQIGQKTHLLHRTWLCLALSLAALLSACGGAGTKYQEFFPSRIVLVGDEISYVGCTVNAQNVCVGADADDRFSLNNTPANANITHSNNSLLLARVTNNWVVQLAALYGLPVTSIVESTYTTSNKSRRDSRVGAQLADIIAQTQNNHIPAYQTGDMLIISGGTHDVLNILINPPNTVPTLTGVLAQQTPAGATNADALLSAHLQNCSPCALTQAQAYQVMLTAQAYTAFARQMLSSGQRNLLLTPIYDFSNSPDLNNFCNGCSVAAVQSAVSLFNFTLRYDPTHVLVAAPGQPRVLIPTGYGTDASYINIAQINLTNGNGLTSTSFLNYNVANSVCGVTSTSTYNTASSLTAPKPLDQCFFSGIFAATTVTGTDNLGNAQTVTYDPTNPADPSYVTNQAFVAVYPATNASGSYIYASDFYLTPAVLAQVGNIFYTFFRGYQGW
jgi:hypothetical protein